MCVKLTNFCIQNRQLLDLLLVAVEFYACTRACLSRSMTLQCCLRQRLGRSHYDAVCVEYHVKVSYFDSKIEYIIENLTN